MREFKNFLNSHYGSENNEDKSILIVAAVFLLLSTMMFVLILSSTTEVSIIVNIAYGYIPSVMAVVSVLMISMYFFQDKKSSNKYKKCKWIFLCICLLAFIIVALPVTIFVGVLNLTKSPNVWKYSTLYGCTLVVSLLISTFAGIMFYNVLNVYTIINVVTVSVFFIFLIYLYTTKFVMFIYFKNRERKIERKVRNNEELTQMLNLCKYDYKQTKTEVYVFTFIVIALATIATNCIRWQYVFTTIDSETIEIVVKSVSNAFAVYIAFDRLVDKWRKAHSESRSVCYDCVKYSNESRSLLTLNHRRVLATSLYAAKRKTRMGQYSRHRAKR